MLTRNNLKNHCAIGWICRNFAKDIEVMKDGIKGKVILNYSKIKNH